MSFYDINAYTNSELAHLSIAVVTPSAEALIIDSMTLSKSVFLNLFAIIVAS